MPTGDWSKCGHMAHVLQGKLGYVVLALAAMFSAKNLIATKVMEKISRELDYVMFTGLEDFDLHIL